MRKNVTSFFLESNGSFARIFTCHFIFSVFFNFASVAKAAICKSRVHRGTPKGGNMSVPFYLNEMAFLHVFLRAI